MSRKCVADVLNIEALNRNSNPAKELVHSQATKNGHEYSKYIANSHVQTNDDWYKKERCIILIGGFARWGGGGSTGSHPLLLKLSREMCNCNTFHNLLTS